jgi:transposase
MQVTLVGIDVSSKKLDVCLEQHGQKPEALEFSNDRKGHKALIKRLRKRRRRARVVMEASGIYHLDLALALHGAAHIEVMVVNPRVAHDFAKATMQRSKTDVLDASMLLEFVRRMEFQPWCPPTPQELELRTLARRLRTLTKSRAQEKNRLHVALCETVRHDIDLNIRHLDRRLEALQGHALALLGECPQLHKQFAHLISIRGVGTTSAIKILGELCVLPKDMTPRQWVALAGLDPRILQSGVSLNAPARISRMGNRALRAALFMPALVAVRWEPQIKAYYEKMIGRQKARMQAIVAVMRKLLHAIHGMLRTETDFDGKKFYAGEKSA